MKFRKIQVFQQGGKVKVHINRRLEFFHHYWTFLLDAQRNKSILIYEEKFESHRSLLIKVRQQLKDENLRRAKRKIINYYFSHHELFKKDNLIIRSNSSLVPLINKIKRLLEDQQSLAEEILVDIQKLESKLLSNPDYSTILAHHLIKILHTNEDISNKIKNDLKFIINSFIVELYQYGYSLKYLENLPDILLLDTSPEEFPYQKDISDFEYNQEAFDVYIKQERSHWTLEKILMGLKNLVEKPILDGFYIFKVDGINFKLKKTLKIWDTEIYNPQKTIRVNQNYEEDYRNEKARNLELFFDETADTSEKSTCNMIIPASFRPIKSLNYPDNSFYTAYRKAQRSLNILNDLRNKSDKPSGLSKGVIQEKNHFLVFANFKFAYSSLFCFNKQPNVAFVLETNNPIQEKFFDEEVKRLNYLNPNHQFHLNLIETNSILRKLRTEPAFFNFTDLWISCFESNFSADNELEEIKDFAFLCIKRRYDLQFLNYSKGFLSSSLKEQKNPFEIRPSYSLNAREYKDMDLECVPGAPIVAGNGFVENYKKANENIDSEVLRSILAEITEFIEGRDVYYERLKKWIDKTIDEVYHERNFEVHSNTRSELNILKLKDDFIYVVNVVSGAMMDQIQKGLIEKQEVVEQIRLEALGAKSDD